MLTQLSITNYAIIKKIELDFNNGFTVITGETGAGKSILLGALSFILGKRADTSVLNDKQKKCVVEGVFSLQEKQYTSFFDENDLDFEPLTIVRREISVKGKSRAFINDTPVSLSVLKELTSELVDLHSQHQTLQVKDAKFQTSVIDAFAGLEEELAIYTNRYSEYIKNKGNLYELISLANNAKTDIDYITFQVNEIEELDLKINEKEKIEAELELINNAEEIKSVLEYSENALISSDQNLLLKLKNITNLFSKISNCSIEYAEIYERLNSVLIEFDDVAKEIGRANNTLSFNPGNLSYLNDRLSKIYSIEQKHNLSSTDEIIELLGQLKSNLSDSNSYDDRVTELTVLVEKQKVELYSLAEKISKKRKESLRGLSDKIITTLILLGMPDASFHVDHQILSDLNEKGLDKFDFLFTSNVGVELKRMSKTASGGELSRLMLSIKEILSSNNNLSSIVFDEIDTGVSGDIADKMASIMKRMGGNMQVIAITHLPQVAAKGDIHYKIHKENKAGKTLTFITKLDKVSRIEELAKMLSGEKLSPEARDNAKSLLSL